MPKNGDNSQKNLQAEFLRGKRKISEDEEAEDLSGSLRGSLEENPSSNSNSTGQQAREGKRRPSESSVSNTSPTHHPVNTLSQPPAEKSPSSYSRMRSPTAGFSTSPNNLTVGPMSPDFVGGVQSFGLSPNYGQQPPSMLSPPGISPAVVEVKS